MTELLVPIQANAIWLSRARQVVGPLADYQRLPWFDGEMDRNGSVPNIASAINAEPFSDHSAWLEAGVHVHWSLPDGLKRGSTERSAERCVQVGELWFPPVPNRWLVVRQDPAQVKERAWLIESDYVHPPGARPPRVIAYPRATPAAGQPPFLYLGRQLELDPNTMVPLKPIGQENAATLGDFGPILTAVASGDPLFTAHYPGCRSVFGLWDDNPKTGTTRDYIILGWFSEGIVEPLGNMVSALRNDPLRALSLVTTAALKASQSTPGSSHPPALPDPDPSKLIDAQLNQALGLAMGERFGWQQMSLQAGQPFPTNIVCCGGTRITAGTDTSDVQPTMASELGIGSSPAEAVAALMLGKNLLSPEDENRLVQVLAATDLGNHPLDLGLKLGEARHTEQFRAYPGHMLWMIRPADQHAAVAEDDPGVSLPDELAHELAALNALQEEYDLKHDAMDGMRQELFADWSRYMIAAYPERDSGSAPADVDRVRGLAWKTRLEPLNTLRWSTGQTYQVADPSGGIAIVDQHPLATVAPLPLDPMVGATSGTDSQFVPPSGPLLGFRVLAKDVVGAVWVITTSTPPMIGPDFHEFRLVGDEYVTAIFGSSGSGVIIQLGFETNHGRRFGPWGGNVPVAVPFRLDAPSGAAIVGLRVRTASAMVVAVGIIVAPPRSTASLPLDPSGVTLASRLVDQYQKVRAMLSQASRDTRKLALALIPGPRFWRPNDPVIVLDASQVGNIAWQGVNQTDGLVTCIAMPLTGGWANSGPAFAGITRAPQSVRPGQWTLQEHPVGVSPADDPAWDVLQLEWELELNPLQVGNTGDDTYATDIITSSHILPLEGADLVERPGISRGAAYQYLAGRTFINPSAARLVSSRRDKIPEDISKQLSLGTVPENLVAMTLGGFHDHLLMLRPEPQIDIADPIGVPSQRDFTGLVRGAVGDFHPASPLPDSPFHPIRSGDLVFERLRMIDRYGRTNTWQPTTIRTGKAMRPDGSGSFDRAVLPVRFAQPARLNFRWLSAADGDIETNAHPATSPVCGWLVPNALDGSVLVYARSGDLLGSVVHGGVWTPAPADAAAPRTWTDITDDAVQNVVRWMTMPATADAIGDFLEALSATLDQIDPQDAARHQARALLIGRPIAIVRARLELVLMSPAATDQSMEALLARIAGAPADTRGIGNVQVPVRLGELKQLNDGLCGYWVEAAALFRNDTFYTPHGLGASAPESRIVSLGDDPFQFPLRLTAEGTEETVTMLVDPRGVVHATCGVLPSKSIAIPPDLWAAQAAALRATFQTMPVLTDPNEVEIPLPAEPGYSWSWLERTNDGWVEVPFHPTVRRGDLVAGFGAKGDGLWDLLVALGRLVPQGDGQSGLLMPGDPPAPTDPKTSADPFAPVQLTTEAVERGLHDIARSIRPARIGASYGPRAVARDGWLQLRQAPAPGKQADKPVLVDNSGQGT